MSRKKRFNGHSNEADWLASEYGITIMPMSPLAWLRRERLWRKFNIHMSQDAISTPNKVALTVVSSWERGRTLPNREHELLMATILKTDTATLDRALRLTRAVGKTYFAIIDAIREEMDDAEAQKRPVRTQSWKALIKPYDDALAKANAWIVEQARKDDIEVPDFLSEEEAVPA